MNGGWGTEKSAAALLHVPHHGYASDKHYMCLKDTSDLPENWTSIAYMNTLT